MIGFWISVTKFVLNIGGLLLIGLLAVGIINIVNKLNDGAPPVEMVTGLTMIASSIFLGFFLGMVAVVFQQNEILRDILGQVKSMSGGQQKDLEEKIKLQNKS